MSYNLSHRHQALLERYESRCSGGWFTGPNDGYFFQHVVFHLRQAGRFEEAQKLIHQLSWLEVKLRLTGINGVLSDFRGDDNSSSLASGLRQAAHILDRHPEMLTQQLSSRLRMS